MEAEESISIEETNRIRESLGLPLIPLENQGNDKSNGKPNTDAEKEDKSNTANDDNISLDETNRIRVSLGLKPIPADSSTLGSANFQDEVAARNWKQKHEEEQKAKEEQNVRKRLQDAKEKRQRDIRLQGKSLGEDDSYNSTQSFLKNLKKAKKNNKPKPSIPEEEEEENVESNTGYSSKDLSGLKVGHKLSDIQSLTQDTVLTLKDGSVLDEEGNDELISETLADKEKLEENKQNKKGVQKYKGYDDDEFDEGNKSNVLGKYDEPDTSESYFILDGSLTLSNPTDVKSSEKSNSNPNIIQESIDFEGIGEGLSKPISSDYQEAKPVKFKKKKSSKDKSKKKRKRIDTEEEEEGEEGGNIKDEDVKMRSRDEADEEEDDSQLQAFLAMSRRKAQKSTQRKHITPEELADQVLNDAEKNKSPQIEGGGGLVIGDTTDFLASITHKTRSKSPPAEEEPSQLQERPLPASEDVHMESTHEQPATEENAGSSFAAPEELSISGGMGNALKLLQSRGVLKKNNEQETERDNGQKNQKELSEKVQRMRLKRDIERQRKREQDRLSGKFDGWTQKEREQYAMEENRAWELEDAREMQKLFADYKPDVQLKYNDEFGRELNTKEAYKHLSHQFHGRGPGKAKIEKQLQRMAEERENEAASIFDVNDSNPSNSGVRLQ